MQSGFDRSSIGANVQDIKNRASMFLSSNFIHVKCCSNGTAHVLAKSAEYDQCCWYSEEPEATRNNVPNEKIMNERKGAAHCLNKSRKLQ